MRLRFGITLVGLLAIVTVLAANVVHHDSAADIQRAQDCLKSITKGVLMYSEDADDLLPAAPKHVAVVSAYVKHFSDFFPFPNDKPSVIYKLDTKGTRKQD